MSFKLYEIQEQIIRVFDKVVDPDTGEILDEEALNVLIDLEEQRDKKIEQMLCWVKSLKAEAKAIREEEVALANRRKVTENKADSIARYIQSSLNGEKFSTPKVSVSYRKSESVEINMVDMIPMEYMKVKYDPDKTAIKKAIKEGTEVPGAVIIEKQNMQIK